MGKLWFELIRLNIKCLWSTN